MKLNQVIAVEKTIKNKSQEVINTLYKSVQHPGLFNGFSKQYQPLGEEGETFASEQQKVQLNARTSLTEAYSAFSELMNIEASKDLANCHAKADVVVDGVTLGAGLPTTYLLFLEKQLTDLHTFVSKLPTLDPAEDWHWDPNFAMYKTQPVQTHKTKKVQKPLVLYPATDKHPAQTQLVTEDVTVGHWVQVKHSSALPTMTKKSFLGKIEKLQEAVKKARQEANLVEATVSNAGSKMIEWLADCGCGQTT